MADYGDTSGGYSDQQIRDIVAALSPPAAPVAAAPAAVMPAPEVTPATTYGTAAAPMDIHPAAAFATPAAPRAKEDDWAPAAPTMTAPTVTPLGAMATVQRRPPVLGGVLGRPQ